MFEFQHPQSASDLLSRLLEESKGAESGGASVAWFTADGITALVEDPVFVEFIEENPFELIFGVDSITNTRSLKRLGDICGKYPKLQAKAIIHGTRSLFHPKMFWFKHSDYSSLIVGSGNLTVGGLKSNFEAFTTQRLTGGDSDQMELALQAWSDYLKDYLFEVDHPTVAGAAAANTGNERALRRANVIFPEFAANEDSPILIAEIPRSGNRWEQANFDLKTYTSFFDVTLGVQKHISLYHVQSDGSLGSLESRPSVQVKSQNYRIELAGAAGLTYPSEGTPLGVFLKTDGGVFLYLILLPEDEGYTALEQLLGPVSGRNKRRVVVGRDSVGAVWPACPLLSAELPAL